jgi:hypothetical protein
MLKQLMYIFMKGDNHMNLEDHVLVKCSRCKGLMGHHIVSDDAVCVDCEIKELCICGEPLTQDHYDHMAKGY